MPVIEKKYQLEDIPQDSLYQDCLEIFKNIGATQIKEAVSDDGVKEINGMVPSIWGWGGLYMTAYLGGLHNNATSITLKGRIEQSAMSPLTKVMDKFFMQLQTVLKEKYGQNFEYEKLTRFLPNLAKDSHERAQLTTFIRILLGCASLYIVLYLIQYILRES